MNLTREWSRQLRLPPVFVSLISSLASVKTWIPIFILLYIISYILYRLFVQKCVNYIISLARFDLQDMQCGLVSWKLLGWKSFNKEEKEHILVWTKPKSVLICLIKMSFGFFFFFFTFKAKEYIQNWIWYILRGLWKVENQSWILPSSLIWVQMNSFLKQNIHSMFKWKTN